MHRLHGEEVLEVNDRVQRGLWAREASMASLTK